MGGLGDRERDSMGPSRWNRGAQSLQAAEWCARKSNCPFTPEIARKHGLKSSHREYELFLFGRFFAQSATIGTTSADQWVVITCVQSGGFTALSVFNSVGLRQLCG